MVCRQWRQVALFERSHRRSVKVLSIDVGMVNLGVCALAYDPSQTPNFAIHDWRVLDLGCKQATKATFKFIDAMDDLPWVEDYEHVAIELQMTSRMKCLSHGMQAYFYAKRKDRTVRFIRGTQKLTVYKGPPVQLPKTYKSAYRMRKEMAHTRLMLGDDFPEELDWFESIDKKDDAADAFLQGLYQAQRMFEEQKKSRRRKRLSKSVQKTIKEQEKCLFK